MGHSRSPHGAMTTSCCPLCSPFRSSSAGALAHVHTAGSGAGGVKNLELPKGSRSALKLSNDRESPWSWGPPAGLSHGTEDPEQPLVSPQASRVLSSLMHLLLLISVETRRERSDFVPSILPTLSLSPLLQPSRITGHAAVLSPSSSPLPFQSKAVGPGRSKPTAAVLPLQPLLHSSPEAAKRSPHLSPLLLPSCDPSACCVSSVQTEIIDAMVSFKGICTGFVS